MKEKKNGHHQVIVLVSCNWAVQSLISIPVQSNTLLWGANLKFRKILGLIR